MRLITVRELVKRFGRTTAVNGVSFTLDEGRCAALLGPNGAGKTTTLKMLSGLLAPTEGSISFEGSEHTDHRADIGYLPQYPVFYHWMSGREYVEYVGKLAGMSKQAVKKRSMELLQLVGLEQAAKRKIGGYSGGMKQRLGIAQALIHSPRLLILDEPVSALDPLGRREVLELLQHIKQHTTTLFSTHVLHDAEEVSDDVMIMQAGQIAISGTLDEVRSAYQEPIIYVQGDASIFGWAEGMAERFGHQVVSMERYGQGIRIQVNDLERMKLAVMEDLVQHEVSVTRFEVAETSLEDLFMKAVGK
ncbi:ATP-binding cassette domain-containing protein [Marinicrinis lubricantis]|uniref:ATP-binding cassette domain-containing protein n=1 Tax=Marinicrinis lubricantis TaxID=2086470 RepID=A0ABW1IU34_9BACL